MNDKSLQALFGPETMQSDLMKRYHDTFVEGTRRWFFDRFERWRMEEKDVWNFFQPPSQALVLSAPPGMGRRAMATRIVKHEAVAASYFCRATDAEYAAPHRVVLSIAGQLATRYAPFRAQLQQHLGMRYAPTTGGDLRNRFLKDPTVGIKEVFENLVEIPLQKWWDKTSTPQERRKLSQSVIVVGALDEAGPPLVDCLVRFFVKLPFKLFVTTKSDSTLLDEDPTRPPKGASIEQRIKHGKLAAFSPVVVWEKDFEEHHTQDIQVYVQHSLEKRQGLSESLRSKVVRTIVQQSQGSFEYARLALHVLQQNNSPPLPDDDKQLRELFPEGLFAYYAAHMERVFAKNPDYRYTATWKTISWMVVAAEPLPIFLLERLLNYSPTQFKTLLSDLDLFFNVSGDRLHVNHKSFIEFLLRKTDAMGRFVVSKAEAIAALATECHRVLEQHQSKLAPYWKGQQERHTSQGMAMRYLLKHTTRHLVEWNDVATGKTNVADACMAQWFKSVPYVMARVAFTGEIYELAQECLTFGQAPASSGCGPVDRRILVLLGQALQASQVRARATRGRELPGQVVGRLSGAAALGGESQPVQQALKKVVAQWKSVAYGFAWYSPKGPAWNPANHPCQLLFKGHTAGVTAVALLDSDSSGGQQQPLLASGSEDCSARVWDVDKGECTMDLQGHSAAVLAVAFSTSGLQLASGSWDGVVRIWNMSTGEFVSALEGHNRPVSTVAFSPRERNLLASGSWDYSIRLWDTSRGSMVKRLTGHKESITAIAFSPDGQILASASEDNTVRLWSMPSGHCMATLEGHTSHVLSLAWSKEKDPKKVILASGSRDKTIRLWNVRTKKVQSVLSGHARPVSSLAFSPRHGLLASASWDAKVFIWNTATTPGKRVAEWGGHNDVINSLAWSDHGLVSGSKDETIRLWNVQSVNPRSSPKTTNSGTSSSSPTGRVLSVARSPDKKLLATGSSNETLQVWTIAKGTVTQTWKGHGSGMDDWSGGIKSLAWSEDGKQLASKSHGDKTVKIWNARKKFALEDTRTDFYAWPPKGFVEATPAPAGTVASSRTAGVDCEQFFSEGKHAVGLVNQQVYAFELIQART